MLLSYKTLFWFSVGWSVWALFWFIYCFTGHRKKTSLYHRAFSLFFLFAMVSFFLFAFKSFVVGNDMLPPFSPQNRLLSGAGIALFTFGIYFLVKGIKLYREYGRTRSGKSARQ